MKLHLVKFSVFCLLLLTVQAAGQENISIIDSLTEEIVNELVTASNGELSTKDIVLSLNNLDGEKAGYLKLKVGNYFSTGDQKIYRNFNGDSSFEGAVIEVDKFQTYIKYSEPYIKELFENRIVKRYIEVMITGQTYDFKSKQIICTVDGKKAYMDEILYSSIDKMENSPYSFSQGVLSDISAWQKFLEPALVISSVVGVLILLFTQRS